jgi:putative endopeptidase
MRKLAFLWVIAGLCLAQQGSRSGIDRGMFDPNCKPCDDFWRYATGTWADQHPIPADRARWGKFDELSDANLERLKVILDSAAADPNATGDRRKVGDYYASCMDTGAIDAAGAKPIEPLLGRIAAIQSRQDLAAMLISLELQIGLAPTSLTNVSDPDNADQVIAGVAVGGLSLPDRDYYFRDDAKSKSIRDAFLVHAGNLLQLLGESQASGAAEAKTVLQFETTLASATLTNVARRDPYQRVHKMSFAQLQALAPAYDWKGAFQILNVAATGPVNVSEPEFLRTLNTQLNQAPIETWKTWLRWRVVNGRAQFLSKAFYDEWFHFDRTVLSGVVQQEPRWKVCVSSTDTTLGEALGRLYVEKHFPPEAQRRVQQLVANMRAALGEELQSADWLAPQTRQQALRKLTTFDPRIGYPVKWRDYSDVEVSRGSYLADKEATIVAERKYDAAKIGKKLDRTEWNMTPPTVNAYYTSSRNSITFPAGILQPPFFEMDADDAVNYGAIGVVIGHEMGHGFDDQGSKYDADGNLKNWWTDQDRAKFEARAACIVNQFDSIDVGEGLHHTGKLVTGEAMGDLGGATLAYKAYHQSLNGKEPPVIDGLTGDQRFFLAYARVWAGSQRPEAMRLQLATNPHPLAKYRTNATLQNMPEFHKAFACKLGDPMVRPPSEQCHLW